MRTNKLYAVWLNPDLFNRLTKEVETFGGNNQREQTENFLAWYFHAKDENRLLKPENKQELPQSPDAPRCKYHTCDKKGEEEVWFCDCIKIEKVNCLNRYRWHNSEKKPCFPTRLEGKRKPPEAFNDNWRKGAGKGIDWEARNYGSANPSHFDFSDH